MSWALPEYIEVTPQNTKTPFKYNVGETVHTPSSDVYIREPIRMFNGLNKTTGKMTTTKGYIYQCERCHYIGLRKEHGFAKHGCPVCDGNRSKWDINSVAAVHPELILLFANVEDAYDYSFSSHRQVDFICPNCHSRLEQKIIKNVVSNGLFCPYCSDGISFGERVMREVLKQMNITFIIHQEFKWSDHREYDFYLPDCAALIEIHGIQHNPDYSNSFDSCGGRTVEEEIENDRYKQQMAIEHNLEYIWVDASFSDFSYIKNAIQGCLFLYLKNPETFNLIDWEQVRLNATQSLIVKSAELWNQGYSPVEITTMLGYSSSTIYNWLAKGRKIGLCPAYGEKRNGSL